MFPLPNFPHQIEIFVFKSNLFPRNALERKKRKQSKTKQNLTWTDTVAMMSELLCIIVE